MPRGAIATTSPLQSFTTQTLRALPRRGVAMSRSQPMPPEKVALVRKLYVDGVPIAEIQARTGVRHLRDIYACLDGKYDDGSGAPPQPIPRRRPRLKVPRRLRSSREALVARLWRTAERQVRDIEIRLAASEQPPDERERDARVLAVLVKTLRELNAIDSAALRDKPQTDSGNDDDGVRDLDEFRRELARKIDRLAAQHSAEGAGRT
jgi:hypothetical protein